ncbi:type III polyketide synthase [Microbacterium rhizomatis]|uniref:Type III polyketide synthase n=1 Tax=Microbacterium rhizomatis TaxID=1631477 RepID=A0A5J5J4H3_9MICO|nr:type III polyketide synthase [Microbacterium rhizomatis]KAA9108370.1 type III polyketide synthase [Microbacterium rhizomatis]
MTARILSIGTAVPATTLAQHDVRDFFIRQPGYDRLARRLVHAAFDAAAIDTRHTVIDELAGGGMTGRAATFVDAEGGLISPSTGERNAIYARDAPPLFAAAARDALAGAGVAASEVTHVVTASCTGFFAPGPDYRLVRDLGLPVTTERYHLGFLGCSAAFPALRAAARICAAQPEAVVLVACGELCTLHIRGSSDPEQIVASSVFADGAAAAIVSAVEGIGHGAALDLERFGTTLTSEGESDMVWIIGDEGFEMTLTAEVPRIIGREIRGAVEGFLGVEPGGSDWGVDRWAVHPGGRSVLDRVESGLDLDGAALAASRTVLRERGNMSSATVLFILAALLADVDVADGESIAGLAFGPGLTVESALFVKRIPESA